MGMSRVSPRGSSSGWIEVITGCMYAGKSSELLRRLTEARWAKCKVQLFKPTVDDRFSNTMVVTHDGLKNDATVVSSSLEILENLEEGVDVVGLDEVQFFDEDVLDVCRTLAQQKGIRVIASGLDKTFLGRTFSHMGDLLADAESVTKLYASCSVCGQSASFSQLVRVPKVPADLQSGDPVLLGGEGLYEPRCRAHFSSKS